MKKSEQKELFKEHFSDMIFWKIRSLSERERALGYIDCAMDSGIITDSEYSHFFDMINENYLTNRSR